MVRGVQADEASLEAHVDSLFRRKAVVEVGLLIGRLAVSSKDLVLALVPTPPKDGEDAAGITMAAANLKPASAPSAGGKKGKGKGGAGGGGGGGGGAGEAPGVKLDEDWIAEHARQVSRMLLGGLQVVGLYLFAPEPTFKNAMPALWQAVKAVADSAPIVSMGGEASGHSAHSTDRLLLHVCSSPKRFTFRSCSLDGTFSSSSLRPCELKLGKLLGSFHSLASTYAVEIRLVVESGGAKKRGPSLRGSVEQALSREAARLAGARAVIGGEVVAPDKSLGVGTTGDPPLAVELLVSPPWQWADLPDNGGDSAVGMVSIKGAVHGRSYAYTREAMGRVIADLKGDILASLRARLDLLVDEAEQALEDEEEVAKDERGEAEARRHEDATSGSATAGTGSASSTSRWTHPLLATREEQGEGGLASPYSLAMPRRVLVPWRSGFQVCDYVMPTEALEDVVERCQAMLGLDASGSEASILEPEGAPAVDLTPQEWSPNGPSSTSTALAKKSTPLLVGEGKLEGHGSKPAQLGILAIILAIVLTMVAVVVSLSLGRSKAMAPN